MRPIAILLIIVFATFNLANSQTQIQSTFRGKHHMLSPDELTKKKSANSFTETPPPTGNIRNIAEFEPNEGVIVAYRGWGFGIPLNLIAEIAEDVNVVTIVRNQTERDDVIQIYLQNGVDTSNCEFLSAYTNSYWTRDYSPWFIDVDGEVALVDFPYNRPRPDDDYIPIKYADAFGMKLYGMNITTTGGNWMCDGLGVAASTDLIYDENSNLSSSTINSLVFDYLGVTKYHITEDPQGAYIKHIDCWGKFLDVDKILIAKVAESNPQYNKYEEMASYWASQTSSYGNNYQVFRVYSPNSQPYTNSLIINNKVLVPLISGYGSAYNEEAMNTYRSAMPGYEVIGFYDNGSEIWEPTDALHCRTHEIPDRYMLYINHKPLLGGQETKNNYEIKADIIPYSKKPVAGARLFYSINGGEYNELIMSYSSGNTYSAVIENSTSKSNINEVAYYLVADDESGRTSMHPFIGSGDPHIFYTGPTSTSIEKIDEFLVSAFPNPCTDRLFVSITSEKKGIATIELKSLSGKLHFSKKSEYHSGKYLQELNVSTLAKGVYFVEVKINGQKLTKKVIVH
jgi:agmatine deiminase